MTAVTLERPGPTGRTRGGGLIAVALRDLRGSYGGFFIFIACIALGVAAIAAVGALADALRHGFDRQGRILLGGDLSATRIHKRASAAELARMAALGRLSEAATLRSMARHRGGDGRLRSALIEIKAVDANYPLAGQLVLAKRRASITGAGLETGSAVVDPILLARLQLKVGDQVQIGGGTVRIAAAIASEPDKLAGRAAFGPRVLMSLQTLEELKLIRPGSLIRWRYRIALQAKESGSAPGVGEARARLVKLGAAGFGVRDRRDPSPGVRQAIDRFGQFLTLAGLATLIVGGIGVANAVSSYLDRKRKTIAIFKSLGASNRQIFRIYVAEIAIMASLGVILGLGLGYLAPLLVNATLGQSLPLELAFSIEPATVALAAAYGFIVSLIFVLWPLGRIEQVRPSVLFRDVVAPAQVRPRWPFLLATLLAGAGLVALAVATSEARLIAALFCAGLAVLFAIFRTLSSAIAGIARRLPRSRRPEINLAIGNIAGPGGLVRTVVLSLGTGLTLLVTVGLVDTSLVRELRAGLPKNAPSFFFLDISKGELTRFRDFIKANGPASTLRTAPMLRGRILKLNSIDASKAKPKPGAEWVLRGDRGLTFSHEVPRGSRVVAGKWWPKNYEGEPLVSFVAELANELDLKVGDTVTVNVLGRPVKARIANLREVKWQSLSINFVMIFSPNTLRAAPYNLLATLSLPKAARLDKEARIAQAIADEFPTVTAIRIRDAIEAVNKIFAHVVMAIRIASGVTLLAGAIVLAGAIATAHRKRIYQAVVLKTVGATRWRILRAHLSEYLLLSLATSLVALGLGSLVAWIIVSPIMELSFTFSWSASLQALGVATTLVLAFGLVGTWRVLSAPPVPHLRAD